MERYKLTSCEKQVMKSIWRRVEATPGEIREDLEKMSGRVFERTTISTWLKHLKEKEAIYVCRKGPVYRASISEDEYVKQEMEEFVEYWFDGSNQKFFAAFCNKEKISKDDLEELINIVNNIDR